MKTASKLKLSGNVFAAAAAVFGGIAAWSGFGVPDKLDGFIEALNKPREMGAIAALLAFTSATLQASANWMERR